MHNIVIRCSDDYVLDLGVLYDHYRGKGYAGSDAGDNSLINDDDLLGDLGVDGDVSADEDEGPSNSMLTLDTSHLDTSLDTSQISSRADTPTNPADPDTSVLGASLSAAAAAAAAAANNPTDANPNKPSRRKKEAELSSFEQSKQSFASFTDYLEARYVQQCEPDEESSHEGSYAGSVYDMDDGGGGFIDDSDLHEVITEEVIANDFGTTFDDDTGGFFVATTAQVALEGADALAKNSPTKKSHKRKREEVGDVAELLNLYNKAKEVVDSSFSDFVGDVQTLDAKDLPVLKAPEGVAKVIKIKVPPNLGPARKARVTNPHVKDGSEKIDIIIPPGIAAGTIWAHTLPVSAAPPAAMSMPEGEEKIKLSKLGKAYLVAYCDAFKLYIDSEADYAGASSKEKYSKKSMMDKMYDRIIAAWPAKSKYLVTKEFLTKLTKRERASSNNRRAAARKKLEATTVDEQTASV